MFIRALIAAILILCVLLCVLLGWAPKGSEYLFIIFSLSLIPLALTLEWVFEAVQTVKIVGMARIARGGSFAALVWLFISAESQIEEPAAYFVITFSLECLIVLVAAILKFNLSRPSFDWKIAKQLIAQALPVGMASFLTQYSLFVGTIIIGFLLEPANLGLYSAAHRLVIFIWVYGIVTSHRVLLPQLSRMFSNSISEYQQFISRVWRILVLAALPVGMVIMINAEEIINLLYGSMYEESASVLQILSGALVIAFFRSVLEISFIASNKQRSYFYSMSGAAIIYTITTLLGVQIWGIQGAAWAAIVSEFCYATLLLLYASEVGKLGVVFTVLRSSLAAAGSVLILMAFHVSSIIFNAVSSIALYFLLLLLMREITIREIRTQIGKVLSPNL